MKSVLKLEIACVLIWTCVVGLFILFGVRAKSNKKVVETSQVSQITENNNSINVVNGDNNTFIIKCVFTF